jgi:uncharacterized protein (TIRG00374 family)
VRETVVVLALALVGVEVVVGHAYLARTLRAVGRAEPAWIAIAILAAVASMAQFARTQRRMLSAAGTHVPIRSMLRLVFEANAINMTLPGGTAFSVGYSATRLRRFGATPAGAGFSLLASGLLSGLTFWALALAYAGLAGGTSVWPFVLAALVFAALAVLAVVARRRPGSLGRLLPQATGRLATVLERRRPGRVARALRGFAGDLAAVHPRRSDWVVGTVFAGLNWLTDLGCLLVCCVAVSGHSPVLLVAIAAYLAGMTASSISVLPGGFGVIEVAMIVTFTAGGVDADDAGPAVLLYRLISCVLVVAIGWVIWLVGRFSRGTRGSALAASGEVEPCAPSARSTSSPTSSRSAIPSPSSMTRTG